MDGHEVQSRLNDRSRTGSDGDRDGVVIGLSAAAVSGFVVGLLVQGGVAQAVLTAVIVALAGSAGWRLRGGL